MKSAGRSIAAGELGDRQGRGVGAEQRVGVDERQHLGEHLRLERRVLEDGLDDEVAAGEVLGRGGRGDPAEQLLGLLRGELAALDALGVELLRVGPALLGRLQRDVLEHDLHAGAGARVGDAGAHHPGAEHADLGGLPALDALRPQRSGVDRLQVEEERLDHVLGLLVDHQVGEVAALDARGGVEVDLRALDRGAHDRARRGVDRALGLLAQQRREGRQELRQRRGLRGAAGHLVAGSVPRVLRGVLVAPVLEDPRLRGGHELLAGRQHLVDQALGQRTLRVELGAGHEHVHQRGLQPQHAYDAGDPAAAGQQAERRLGQADLDRAVVDRDAAVGRQRDLEATAEGGTVDRRDHGPREGLEPAQAGLDRLAHREDLVGVVGGRGDHALEVAAGEEGLLGAGQHDAGDVVLLVVQPLDGRLHGPQVELVHGVGAGGRVVEGQGDDAVGVAVVADRGLGVGVSHASV